MDYEDHVILIPWTKFLEIEWEKRKLGQVWSGKSKRIGLTIYFVLDTVVFRSLSFDLEQNCLGVHRFFEDSV